jgi:hypothetical protein
MNTKLYLFMAALTGLAAGCSTDETETPAPQGQKIVISAVNNVEDNGELTRASYEKQDNDDLESVSVKWTRNDKVKVFAGTETNLADFSVKEIEDNDAHKAIIEGTLPTPLTAATPMAAYVENSNVKLVDNDKHVEVDFSSQKGTFDDAMSRSLLFATATYDPAAGKGVKMHFAYKTSFMKLTLHFGSGISGTASLRLTGNNVLSSAWINSIYNGGGGTNKKVEGAVNVPEVAISDGTAVVYIALYPQEISSVKVLAQLSNGDLYDFDVTEGKTKKIQSGRLYQLARTGTKTGNVNDPATAFDGGDGTAANPYLIANRPQLLLLQQKVNNGDKAYNSKAYKLTADIALDGLWTPIGTNENRFSGTFDGDNHAITGTMTVKELAVNDGAGLFGVISKATVKHVRNEAAVNVTVKDASKNGTYTGAIVGRAVGANSIEHCTNTASVTSNGGFTGGIVGQVYLQGTDASNVATCRIEACANDGNVTNASTTIATSAVGGIVGTLNTAKNKVVDKVVIVGCYNRDNEVAFKDPARNSTYVAGIAGYANHNGEADNIEIYACWESAAKLAGKGAACIVASAGTTKYNVHHCWVRWVNEAKIYGTNKNMPYSECAHGSAVKPYGTNVETMNTAWASATYSFNKNTGEINTKK